MGALTVALLGMLATLAAALASPLLHERMTRTATRRAQRARAAEAYVAAVLAVGTELAQIPGLPKSSERHGWLRRKLEPHGGEVMLYLHNRLLERIIFGDRIRTLLDRLASAHAQLLTARPSEDLTAVINRVNTFMESWSANLDSSYHDQWSQITHELNLAVSRESCR
jgi:hypothetical protein